MLVPHTADRLHEAVRLINTAAGPRGGQYRPDQLDTAASLSREFPDRQFASAGTEILQQVHGLRENLTQLWSLIATGASDSRVQEQLNDLLAAHGPVRLQLESDEATWVLGAETGPAVERFTRDLVMALAEAAVAGELHRLRLCAGTDCSNALVDVTRNSSKQFCDEANCANRTHVRAYRQRQASGEQPAPTDASSKKDKPVTPAPAKNSAKKTSIEPESDEESAKISRKIRKLSTRLQDPELSKKDRKKVAKKFKKLRKKLKGSADADLLERLAPAVKK